MVNIRAGQIVQLRSGGPLMTVRYLASSKVVACSWSHKGAPVTNAFYFDELFLVTFQPIDQFESLSVDDILDAREPAAGTSDPS